MSEPIAKDSTRYRQPAIVRRDSIAGHLMPIGAQSDGPPPPDVYSSHQ